MAAVSGSALTCGKHVPPVHAAAAGCPGRRPPAARGGSRPTRSAPSCATRRPRSRHSRGRPSADRADGRSSSMTSTSAQAQSSRGSRRTSVGRPGWRSDGDGEPERAADADLALQPHPTAHQADDAPAQRQTEARALLRRAPRGPCWNDSKIRSRSSGATPMPVSVTVMTTSPSVDPCIDARSRHRPA